MIRTYVDIFSNKTSFNLVKLFEDVVSFFKSDYSYLKGFYQGTITSIPASSVKELKRLRADINRVYELWEQHQKSFNDAGWWELMSIIDTIDSKLKTATNVAKWSRSTISGNLFSNQASFDYIQKSQQTLERITKDVLGSSDPEMWLTVSRDNNLKETDYSLIGGKELSLTIPRAIRSVVVRSVVDVINGKAIYGKDLPTYVSFVDDDLVCLDYDQTIEQAVNILIRLKQNDHPGYPNDGLQWGMLVGGNRALFNFPAISRQLREVFATDDTLTNFTITQITVEEDKFYIAFTVNTRLSDSFEFKIPV